VAAFAEKLEDLSPDVKAVAAEPETPVWIEARRVELNALILAEVDAATATVRGNGRTTRTGKGST
jgi:hypothetical protein